GERLAKFLRRNKAKDDGVQEAGEIPSDESSENEPALASEAEISDQPEAKIENEEESHLI
ncbi:MAG: hypothetical protein IKN56_01845, partial [Clostridia bacterium]|nr:hypothetical protein [Clostridia bacterium]